MQVVNFIFGPLDQDVAFYSDEECISGIEVPELVQVKDFSSSTSAFYEVEYAAKSIRYVLRRYKADGRVFVIAAPDFMDEKQVLRRMKEVFK